MSQLLQYSVSLGSFSEVLSTKPVPLDVPGTSQGLILRFGSRFRCGQLPNLVLLDRNGNGSHISG